MRSKSSAKKIKYDSLDPVDGWERSGLQFIFHCELLFERFNLNLTDVTLDLKCLNVNVQRCILRWQESCKIHYFVLKRTWARRQGKLAEMSKIHMCYKHRKQSTANAMVNGGRLKRCRGHVFPHVCPHFYIDVFYANVIFIGMKHSNRSQTRTRVSFMRGQRCDVSSFIIVNSNIGCRYVRVTQLLLQSFYLSTWWMRIL